MRKALSIALAFVGLFETFIAFSSWKIIGLFLAMVASFPGFLILLFGYSSYSGHGFKKAFGQWLLFVFAVTSPWLVILPFIYQLLSLSVLAIVGASAVLWFRRRRRSQ